MYMACSKQSSGGVSLVTFVVFLSAVDDDGSISWRENEHDDLVFALMLACYYFERIARQEIQRFRAVLR
jgi:hypothetical protein